MEDDHLQTEVRDEEHERARSHTRQHAAGERMFDPGRQSDRHNNDGRLDEETRREVPVEEIEFPLRAGAERAVEFVVFGAGQAVQAREPAVEGGDAEGRGGDADVDGWSGFGDVLEEEVEQDGEEAGADHVDGDGDGDGDGVFGEVEGDSGEDIACAVAFDWFSGEVLALLLLLLQLGIVEREIW